MKTQDNKIKYKTLCAEVWILTTIIHFVGMKIILPFKSNIAHMFHVFEIEIRYESKLHNSHSEGNLSNDDPILQISPKKLQV